MTDSHRARLVELFCRIYADTKSLDSAIELTVLADRDRGRTGPQSKDNGDAHRIIEAVCRECGLTQAQLQRSAVRQASDTRKVCMKLLRDAGYSYPKIARLLGLMDHTTVLKGVMRVAERPDLVERVETVRSRLYGQERAA